jgi:hypothetical protein
LKVGENKMGRKEIKIPNTDKPKNKGGRPKKPIPEDKCIIAHEFAVLGATNTKIAEVLGITVSLLQKWMAKDKGFGEAVRTGRRIPSAKVAKSIYERAKGFPVVEKRYERKEVKDADGNIRKNPDGTPRTEMVLVSEIHKQVLANVAAAKFFLWNRTKMLPPEEQWTDKQHHDHSSQDRTMSPKEFIQSGMSPQEAARLYQQTVREGKVKK